MSDPAVEVASAEAERKRVTADQLWQTGKAAAARLQKAGSKEALAFVLAQRIIYSSGLYLPPDEFGAVAELAIAKEVGAVKAWEKDCKAARSGERALKMLAEIESGTWQPPRKRRRAKKRRASNG